MTGVSRSEHEKDIRGVHDSIEEHDLLARERLDEFKLFIEERFKWMHTRMMLYIGAAAGIIKFDLPKELTVAALAVVAAKFLMSLLPFRS